MHGNGATARKVKVVAIHGVGDRKPGDVLDAVIRGLSEHGSVRSDKSAKYYRGHCYQHAQVRGHPVVASVLEVNWDDISYPARSPLQYVKHFISLLASILRVAVQPIETAGKPSKWASAYRWVFNALLIWCVYLPIVTIGGFAPAKPVQVAWIFCTFLIVTMLAWLFSPYDKGFRAGFGWAAGIALVGIACIAGEQSRSLALSAATLIYGGVQGLAGVALVGAMVVAWRQGRQVRKAQQLARLALFYLPFALFSGIGALEWAGALAIATGALPETSFTAWSTAYLERLSYDLAFAEVLLATGVALGSLLLLLPAYPLIRDDHSGARVHARLLTALKYFALIVVAVLVLYLAHLPIFIKGGQYAAFNAWVKPWLWMPASNGNPDVFQIYRASALRLLPFLVYFVGHFRVILDTIGDVLLYIDPEGRLSRERVREGSQKRLRDALRIVCGEEGLEEVVLVAHSQGSAIAADVLSTAERSCGIRLVTMGSPISSLYWRFIGARSVSLPRVAWLNIFRTGDYIAGGLGIQNGWAPPSNAEDQVIGAGRHSGYFEDPKVWDAVCKWVETH